MNELDALMRVILARMLVVARETVRMPGLVNADYSRQTAEKGDTINVSVSKKRTAQQVVAAPNYPANQATEVVKVPIALDQHWFDYFHLTDEEQHHINATEQFLPNHIEECARSVSHEINKSIFSKYVRIPNLVGTVGVTPFGSGDQEDIVEIRQALNENLALQQNRRVVLDHAADAAALKLDVLVHADKRGSAGTINGGLIGTTFGMDFFNEDDVPTHTTAATGAWTVNGAVTAGSKTIPITGGTADPGVGDTFVVAGVRYAVEAFSGGVITVSATEGTVAALSGGESLTFDADHVVNVAFHRDAWAFAMRPMAQTPFARELSGSKRTMSMTDSHSGLTFRLTVVSQHFQTTWYLDALWGTELVRPEWAVRLAG